MKGKTHLVEIFIPKTTSNKLGYVLEKAKRFGELEETEFEYVARFGPEALEEAIGLWDIVKNWKGASIYYNNKRVSKKFFISKTMRCMRERLMKEDAEIYCPTDVGLPQCFDLHLWDILPMHLDYMADFSTIDGEVIKIDKSKLSNHVLAKYSEVKHCIFAPSKEKVIAFLDSVPESIPLNEEYSGIWADYVKQLQEDFKNRKENREEKVLSRGIIESEEKKEPLITDTTELPYCPKCKEVVFEPKEEYVVGWNKSAICFGFSFFLALVASVFSRKETPLLSFAAVLGALSMLGGVVFFVAALVVRLFRIKRYLCPTCGTKVKWLKGAEAAKALTDTMFKNVKIKIVSGSEFGDRAASLLEEMEDVEDSREDGDIFWQVYECHPRLLLDSYLEQVAMVGEEEQIVESFTGRDEQYKVNLYNLTCTCMDFKEERKNYPRDDVRRLCKHLIYCMDMAVDLTEVFQPEMVGYLFKYLALKRRSLRPYVRFRRISIDSDYAEVEAIAFVERDILYAAEITEKDYGSTWTAVLLGSKDGSVKLVWDPNEWEHFPSEIRDSAETLLAKVASQYKELMGRSAT